MDIGLLQILLTGLIIGGCSFIQGVAGFAYSLLAVPLLMLVGFQLPDAVLLSLPGSITTRLLVVQHCRQHIQWKPLWGMLPFCAIGLVIGVFCLKQLTTLPSETVRQYIGAIILLTVAMRLFVKIEPVDSVLSIWGFTAAFFSGILGGTANIGGPPLVLWVVAHKWSTECTRAIMPAFTLMTTPLQLVLLWIGFGGKMWAGLGLGALYLPLIFLAVWLSNRTSRKLSQERMRLIIITLLAFIGAGYLFSPMLKGLFV